MSVTHIFWELPEEKRTQILSVCLEEFARYGYAGSSTNRIVERAGIAKGSLFKYFENKEDLYLFILDWSAQKILGSLQARLKDLPADLCERVLVYTAMEMDLYIENPLLYKIFKRAMANDGSTLYQRVYEKYYRNALAFLPVIFDGVDTASLRWGLPATLDVLGLVLKGMKDTFEQQSEREPDLPALKESSLQRLDGILTILKTGIYKKSSQLE